MKAIEARTEASRGWRRGASSTVTKLNDKLNDDVILRCPSSKERNIKLNFVCYDHDPTKKLRFIKTKLGLNSFTIHYF